MKPVRTFNVVPSLPSSLERLRDLAYNLRWSWDHGTIALFRRLDSEQWETSGHNPVRMLGTIDQSRLDTAESDDGFRSHLDGVLRYFDAYMSKEKSWFRREFGASPEPLVAYFSAEFGLTECLSIFAGGLGLLAGEHLKSASDLGVPLVGVGLLYQQGYFSQYLNDAGWQQEAYRDNDFSNLPLLLERRPDGSPLVVPVTLLGRAVWAQIWRAQVGRVNLYLLDTNIPANAREDWDITDQLYGGDLEMRIKQEMLLGIGGYRALEALGLSPAVYHMNEGHSAFLALEHIRRLVQTQNLSFAQAREAASASLVFTTHTPVPAGHDYFPPDLIERYLADYEKDLGIDRWTLLGLGRQNPFDDREYFCMTVLALRMAAYSNGVSRLHGQVSRQMWQSIWPRVPHHEIPIGHVTNGVHFRSWISREMDQIYDRYLGPRWKEEPADERVWRQAEHIPAEELWRTHEIRRARLVSFARQRLRAQLERRGAPQAEIEQADEVLNNRALTIGFARRFATYKRASLLLRDPERLARILNDPEKPVQIIFSGKAHPKDNPGKEVIRQIVAFCRQHHVRHRMVFLEDYDMAVARYLVQGADVWLNTPRRPLEASGTSGMKAAANGVLNLSTLDGWWDEAWTEAEGKAVPVGWAIGRGEVYDNPDYQDEVEAEALYDLLERDIIPTFYRRGPDELPREWIARMKSSIATLCHFFNTHRMVREYTERFYLTAADRSRKLAEDDFARARALAAWKARVQEAWPQVRVESVEAEPKNEVPVRGRMCASAQVQLGSLTPDDVTVQLYLGRVNADGEIVEGRAEPMRAVEDLGERRYRFLAEGVTCHESGLFGYTVRVLPHHPDLVTDFWPGLITWA